MTQPNTSTGGVDRGSRATGSAAAAEKYGFCNSCALSSATFLLGRRYLSFGAGVFLLRHEFVYILKQEIVLASNVIWAWRSPSIVEINH